MLFYSLKILLEYISDRLISCWNLSLDFGTFLTHHWKLEDPRTFNVSRYPTNQTADQGIPQGLLGRWAGGYIGLLGSREYIVNINRRCYGCKRLFWLVLCIFAESYPQCEKNVNDLFLQIHSSSNLSASKETNLFWHLSISLKWCTLWPESMSPTFLVNCNDCNFSFQRKSSSKLCVLLFENPITWLLVWSFHTKNVSTIPRPIFFSILSQHMLTWKWTHALEYGSLAKRKNISET